jgi:transcriptional regulator with XRE-family HTH domain
MRTYVRVDRTAGCGEVTARRRSAQPTPELLALAGAIRHLRRERELSQEALAFAAGVHPKHVSEIERANKDPRTTTIVRIAEALGVTVGALYDLSEAQSGKPPT